jgi:hypothetical protein
MWHLDGRGRVYPCVVLNMDMRVRAPGLKADDPEPCSASCWLARLLRPWRHIADDLARPPAISVSIRQGRQVPDPMQPRLLDGFQVTHI